LKNITDPKRQFVCLLQNCGLESSSLFSVKRHSSLIQDFKWVHVFKPVSYIDYMFNTQALFQSSVTLLEITAWETICTASQIQL